MKTFNDHLSFYAWDFAHAEGDTIREKYLKLYELIDISCCVRSGKDDSPYIITNKELASVFVVLETLKLHKKKIVFEPKYEKLDNDILYHGRIYTENSNIKSGFEIYEDPNAPHDKILICTEKGISLLYIFNYF